jgi:hypothetical protein
MFVVIKFLLGCLLCCCWISRIYVVDQKASESLYNEITNVSQVGNQQMTDLEKVARKLFENAHNVSSINSTAVTAFFGRQGLSLPDATVQNINYSYFYLEYVVRREKAAGLITLLQEQGKSFPDVLLSINNNVMRYDWTRLVPTDQQKSNLIVPSASSWVALDNALEASLAQERKGWDQIGESSFWKNIPVTTSDLVHSSFWQKYNKLMIKKTFIFDQGLLCARYENEKELFKYLPALEVAYFHPDFIQLRSSAELTKVSLLLSENTRNRMIAAVEDLNNKTSSPQHYDWEKIMAAVDSFAASDFFTIAHTLSTASSGSQSPFQQSATNTLTFKPLKLPSPLAEEITCLSMIVALQALTYGLFKKDKLDTTVSALKSVSTQPIPSLLPYTSDDYLYLKDFNHLVDEINKASAPAASGQTLVGSSSQNTMNNQNNPRVKPQSFVDWLNKTGSDVLKTIVDAGQALVATASDITQIAENETLTLYYSSGLAEKLQSLSPEQAQQYAKLYQDAVSKDFDQFRGDIQDLLHDATKLVTYPAYAEIELLISTLAQDPTLSGDFDAMWNSLIDTVATTVAAPLKIGSYAFQQGLQLSNEAVSLISNVAASRITMSKALKQFGVDLVSSVLATATFTLETAKEAIVDLIKTCGYLIKVLTDVIIDTVAGIIASEDSIAASLGGGGASYADYYAQEQAQVGTHRRLIAQIVTTGIIIGLTVATGGTGAALAVGVGTALAFGSLMITGGAQEDTQVEEAKQEMHDYVQDFQVWTVNREKMLNAQQIAWSDELNKKFAAEINNRERTLGFYQNFLNGKFNQLLVQESAVLGNYQSQLLTPSSDGLPSADVGSVYGYSTGWLNLNPGQGFVLYTPSRKMLSQEIAESVASINSGSEESIARFWFKQNITKDIDQSPGEPLTVEMRIMPIYLLNTFYTGLLLGGDPLDKDTILKQQRANLDREHLAKMIVFKREGERSAIKLGVYEHESSVYHKSDGWVASELPSPSFEIGVWYRMKASLHGSTLSVSVWKEGDAIPQPMSFDVTATSQRTMGVIFSGASVEFEIVTPPDNQNFKRVGSLYPEYEGPNEKDREVREQESFTKVREPVFGGLDLIAARDTELIKGNFIYTSTKTGLSVDTGGAFAKDYGVFGLLNQDVPPTVAHIGQEPMQVPTTQTVFVSLITGNVFDNTGAVCASQRNVWKSYSAKRHIDKSVVDAIVAATTSYLDFLAAPKNFEPLNLRADSRDISQGQFIYTTSTKAAPLDYVIMAKLSNENAIIDTGMPYSEHSNGILSLVTGLLYERKNQNPIDSGYTDQLAVYQKTYGNVRSQLEQLILKASKAYEAQQKNEGTVKQADVKGTATTSSTSISAVQPPTAPAESDIFNTSPPAAPNQSLTSRQSDAAGDEGWG